jgi:hypothetical protein
VIIKPIYMTYDPAGYVKGIINTEVFKETKTWKSCRTIFWSLNSEPFDIEIRRVIICYFSGL